MSRKAWVHLVSTGGFSSTDEIAAVVMVPNEAVRSTLVRMHQRGIVIGQKEAGRWRYGVDKDCKIFSVFRIHHQIRSADKEGSVAAKYF